MDTTTDRSALEGKLIPELQQIAQSMGVEGAQKLRKAGLIDAIVARSGGDAPSSVTTMAAAVVDTTSTGTNGEARTGYIEGGEHRGSDASRGERPLDDRSQGGERPRGDRPQTGE